VIRRKPARPVGLLAIVSRRMYEIHSPNPALRTLPTQFESFYAPVENSVVS
jgi:hypothetical protein